MNWREKAAFAYAKQERRLARLEAMRREEQRTEVAKRLQKLCGIDIAVSLRDDGTMVAYPDLRLWILHETKLMAARICPHCGYGTGTQRILSLEDIGNLYVTYKHCTDCHTELTHFDVDSISDEDLEATADAS